MDERLGLGRRAPERGPVTGILAAVRKQGQESRMQWIGKLIGTTLGLFGGRGSLMGALAGFVLGHAYDLKERQARAGATDLPRLREAFYDTTFSVMGHLAKLDGRVSESEIAAARDVMRFLDLSAPQVERAITCFGRGKAADYPLGAEIERLRGLCAGQAELLRMFIELQMRAALAGNGLVEPVRGRLRLVGEALGFSALELAALEAIERARRGDAPARPAGSALADAYALLGIAPQASDEAVKKAYRRQMSENHPDKLVARGLPESMQELAKEKTQRVREAYETIAASRGFR